MDTVTRPTLRERVRGRRIQSQAYDAENGRLVLEIEGGAGLLISVCREGVHVVLDEAPRNRSSRPRAAAYALTIRGSAETLDVATAFGWLCRECVLVRP